MRTRRGRLRSPSRPRDECGAGPDDDTALRRIPDIGIADLTELVTDAWLAQAPKTLVKAFLAEHP